MARFQKTYRLSNKPTTFLLTDLRGHTYKGYTLKYQTLGNFRSYWGKRSKPKNGLSFALVRPVKNHPFTILKDHEARLTRNTKPSLAPNRFLSQQRSTLQDFLFPTLHIEQNLRLSKRLAPLLSKTRSLFQKDLCSCDQRHLLREKGAASLSNSWYLKQTCVESIVGSISLKRSEGSETRYSFVEKVLKDRRPFFKTPIRFQTTVSRWKSSLGTESSTLASLFWSSSLHFNRILLLQSPQTVERAKPTGSVFEKRSDIHKVNKNQIAASKGQGHCFKPFFW